MVRKENTDAMPVMVTIATAAKTIQRILTASLTVLIRSFDAPALFAALEMTLIRASAINQATATIPIASAICMITLSTICLH
jgi:hypothetical protein